MPTVPLFTYRDATRHVTDWLGANPTEPNIRDARRAVRNAHRQLGQDHRWSYLKGDARLDTVAAYTTGTIAYQHTGGTFERQLTLTTGTWPTWAAYGTVLIARVTYQVATRESNTVVTLSVNSNPGADIAAGTAYTIYRDTYPLPSDFLAIERVNEATNQYAPVYVHPGEWLDRQRQCTVASPKIFTITNDPNYFNTMAWRFWPAPDNIYHYNYLYNRRMRPLVYEEYSTGTATATSGSATLAGTGTSWNSNYIGSVIRLSADTTNPPEALEWRYPYAVERIITAVASTTSLTVDTSFPDTLTGVKYIISDPVDVEDGAMLNAFLRCCEMQVATSKTMKGNKAEAEASYMKALIQAREADSRFFGTQVQGFGQNYRVPLRDMPITLP